MIEPDKRYLVFTYFTHDSLGGLRDMKDSFDNLQDAIKFKQKGFYPHIEIYDRIKGIEIFQSDYEVEI